MERTGLAFRCSREENKDMNEIAKRSADDLLRSTVSSLESAYRAYRRAADRYNARAERGLRIAMHLLQSRTAEGAAAASPEAALVAPPALLTNRETQMLKLIAAGHSTKQAAFLLGIRFKTVGHRSQLMKKLEIHDTATLVRFAIRIGLIEP
jgi:DNA-binding NarL/FixJ family response regulator